MKVGFAQLNSTVGDISGNAAKILSAYEELDQRGAEIVLTPELALCGYPPLDLLFAAGFVRANKEAVQHLQGQLRRAALLVGYVDDNEGGTGKPFHNAAALLVPGKPPQIIRKSLLPTYDVFDEARYFEPSSEVRPLQLNGQKIGVTICEDLWTADYLPRSLYQRNPVQELASAGAQCIFNISASPYQMSKVNSRCRMIRELSTRYRIPFFYCNAIGGNDQLVFDGHSLAVTPAGWHSLPGFQESLELVEKIPHRSSEDVPVHDKWEELFQALVLGVRDYMKKCGFRSCVLGLSGGIDSAVTAAIAVAAVGRENVLGVAMPGPYSSEGSIADALQLAHNLGIRCPKIPITQSFEALREQLAPMLDGANPPEGTMEENLQARLRGITLMALSNQYGSLVLSTGNKSELAVGYCTLYGDMCGGLAAISDVPKTSVYHLAQHINRHKEIIPLATIEKPPSAELRPDQTDQDTLPPYEILDEILRLYVEENCASSDMIKRGFDPKIVHWILHKVDTNEYKRKQAAPGIKVTRRAFGMGRRIPIAQKFLA
ncbi:MAG: NAD+ synthase [Verrucomicrobia bacterium]|nr:MAG: NAD+ synthase [Verrucomicrobiota bacterium]